MDYFKRSMSWQPPLMAFIVLALISTFSAVSQAAENTRAYVTVGLYSGAPLQTVVFLVATKEGGTWNHLENQVIETYTPLNHLNVAVLNFYETEVPVAAFYAEGGQIVDLESGELLLPEQHTLNQRVDLVSEALSGNAPVPNS